MINLDVIIASCAVIWRYFFK